MQFRRENDPFGRMAAIPQVDAATIRSVMQQVYMWMTLALLTTAGVAVVLTTSGVAEDLANSPFAVIGTIIGQLGLVFYLAARLGKMAPAQAAVLFAVYSALMGVTMSLIFMTYTTASVGAAFVSAGSLFAAMSIFGATTEMDLTSMGSFLFMGLIGLIIAMFVNILIGSAMIEMLISVAGVLIFTGLTAYDTQRIAGMAGQAGVSGESAAITRVSIMGALILYLDFINLFLFILRLIGNRR